MNNEQELDDVKYFPRQWLQHWLEHLRQLHGSLTFLHTKGGLSSRYTEIEPALYVGAIEAPFTEAHG